MYTLTQYGAMISDEGRMRPYAEALRRHVFPGCVVADLGAGTGIFSLLACQFGAARVYAIEPDASILVARECAAANGYAERITCIQALSTEVELPERVDLVVSDMRGALPIMDFHFKSIVDARARLLKPDGRLIPLRDTIRCAPVEATSEYTRLSEPWTRNDFGIDLSLVDRYVKKAWEKMRSEPDRFLAPPAEWVTINYTTVTDSDLDGEVEWTIVEGGTLHGLVIWFDTELTEGIGYSNAPGLPELVYGRSFIPFSEPVSTIAGDRLKVRLRTNLVRNDHLYRWDTTLSDSGGTRKAAFRQSTLGRGPPSLDSLRKRSHTFVPTLAEQGQIDRFVLDRMDGAASLHEISKELTERFPLRFPDWHRALDVVSELSARFAG